MKPHHPQASVPPRWLLIANLIMAAIYFAAITFVFTKGNLYLFSIFIVGEVFHLWQVYTFTYTIWSLKTAALPEPIATQPSVDIYITVAGEPIDIVRQTARAALAMPYINKTVYLLNDGLVAGKSDWQSVEELGDELGIECITRRKPGGAKAGNINNALRETNGELIVIFDADHVPLANFLDRTVGYFADHHMGFVQTPQYYHNYSTNYIAGGAWEQQELFFGPILQGKNHLNSVFMCGTNVVIRRTALEAVGGLVETNIAEDFLTSLFLHEQGWKSVYVPEVLAAGLAPEDFSSYYKQQYRWARGSLEVIFKYNPLTRSGLSFAQKIQYLTSASYYLGGFIVLMNALLPVIFFFTGEIIFRITTMSLAAIFIPYIFISLITLQYSSNYTFTFRALAFSYGSFWLQIRAVISVLFNQKTSFIVTSKQQVKGNFLHLAVPNIIYVVLAVTGGIYAVYRDGLNASVVTNIAWAILNIGLFSPLILAATPFGSRRLRTDHQPGAIPVTATATDPQKEVTHV